MIVLSSSFTEAVDPYDTIDSKDSSAEIAGGIEVEDE